MKISRIEIDNFRLLKEFSVDLEENLSLIVGKNNTGKTSLLTILDKFLNPTEKNKFTYNDFNIDFKNELKEIISSDETISKEDYVRQGIKLRIFIEYTEEDDLENISRVLMDLDPKNNIIVLGFEYALSYDDYNKLKREYHNFITNGGEINTFFQNYEIINYFNVRKYSFEYNKETEKANENNFISIDEEKISIKDIINFKYISAKRAVANKEKEGTLSKQTSLLYKKIDNEENAKIIEKFKKQLIETDKSLNSTYDKMFRSVLQKVKTFGGIKSNETNIKIISSLQHRELLDGNTTVTYSHNSTELPEHYNGLGYMNLISMIFEIEILLNEFIRKKDEKPADINLLFIEEPEAHTHPQMQYIFIKNIKKLLSEGIKKELIKETKKESINRPLQYIITTHSSHIVADSDFDDIKYLKLESKNNVIAKNLSELKQEYENDTKQYDFLKQYLTISRAEAFFVDKAILIEGDTERILIPTFMKKIDIEAKKAKKKKTDNSLPLLSQNISIIEVGAYSQIFQKFIDFLGIKALIITDIDSVNENRACKVSEGTATSNKALEHYFPNITWDNLKTLPLEQRIINNQYLICYQQKKNRYHARSFEDAFIHINKNFIKSKKDTFKGLKNRNEFEKRNDAYDLVQKCIAKKTHFALDILYHSDKEFSNWEIPSYIKEGLLWLKKD